MILFTISLIDVLHGRVEELAGKETVSNRGRYIFTTIVCLLRVLAGLGYRMKQSYRMRYQIYVIKSDGQQKNDRLCLNKLV